MLLLGWLFEPHPLKAYNPGMRLRLCILLVVALACAALPADSLAASSQVKVMSRNLYLGADLIPLALYGKNPAMTALFSKGAGRVWNNVQKTAWPVRVKGLAKELAAQKPDLVGLQEAALWQKSITPNGAPNKTVYDYLQSLVAETAKLGVRYRALAAQDEFDFTAPTNLGFKIRFTQRDAILIRVGSPLTSTHISRGRYSETFKVDTPVGTANSRRGWIAANLKTSDNKTFRFVTTHLEAYGDGIRNSQAAELLTTGLADTGPTILVGDLNSDPGKSDASGDAYRTLTGGGMQDAFPSRVATDGQDGNLKNPTSKLSAWLDHIMTRGMGWSTLSVALTGNRTSDRVGGLWPSDHAGVVAILRLG